VGILRLRRDAQDDAAVRGVILTGAATSFIAGADINELAQVTAVEASSRALRQAFSILSRISARPVIAR